jgi:hypothetical protein
VVCDRMLGPVAVLLCNRCCLGSYGPLVALSEGVAGAWWIKLAEVSAVQRGVVLRQHVAAACTLQYSTVLQQLQQSWQEGLLAAICTWDP